MIPKIIHYCWFGESKKPVLILRCFESWQKFLPEYEFILWDEKSFDINKYPFVKEAYAAKKFAFVADVVRLYALVEHGGIYLDTDIEIIRPFDDLLHLKAFMGFEQTGVIQTGVIGAEKAHPIMKKMLEYYVSKERFSLEYDANIANSTLFARYFSEKGMNLENESVHYDDISLFSSEYFCPINQATQEIVVSNNTYTIHYLAGSWLPLSHRISRRMKRIIGNTFGFGLVSSLRKCIINAKKWRF